jgi:nickel superoxide dismutase
MKKVYFQLLVCFSFLVVFTMVVFAHCEIPCGIYDDEMRVKMIEEHIATIEKSMNKIVELEKKLDHNNNQLIRWIMNKESHADALQEIITQYFMTQRIKPDTKKYEKKLELLHQMLIYSMKCKQTVDFKNVNKLKEILKDFKGLYFKYK